MQAIKITLLAVLFISAGNVQAQKKMTLAKSYESYLAMFHNKEVRMVRSHGQFAKFVTRDKVLSKYFNAKSTKQFIMNLIFCEDGLVAFKYGSIVQQFPEKRKEIVEALSRGFGWDPGTLGVDYEKNYCAAPDCKSTDDAICIGDNCGSSSLTTGRDYYQKL